MSSFDTFKLFYGGHKKESWIFIYQLSSFFMFP
jgi:hypothetical protein